MQVLFSEMETIAEGHGWQDACLLLTDCCTQYCKEMALLVLINSHHSKVGCFVGESGQAHPKIFTGMEGVLHSKDNLGERNKAGDAPCSDVIPHPPRQTQRPTGHKMVHKWTCMCIATWLRTRASLECEGIMVFFAVHGARLTRWRWGSWIWSRLPTVLEKSILGES